MLGMIKRALTPPSKTYAVYVEWDSDAKVWIAYSDDIPGLATEATDPDALKDRIIALAIDLVGEEIRGNHSGVLMQPKSMYIPFEGNAVCA
jgi:predicted RNase H-like HicB family nuclease